MQSKEVKVALKNLRRSITPEAVQHKAHIDYMRERKVMVEAYDSVIGDIVKIGVGEEIAAWVPEYSWDFFGTITNRNPRRDGLAFMRDIAEAPGYERLLITLEPHKLNRNLHAHCLIATPEPASLPWRGEHYGPYTASDFWEKWFHRFGGTRVETIRCMQDVADYIAKYVTKVTDGDNYGFYGQDELSWIR